MCSTPRGITGKIASRRPRNLAGVASAQRLAASPEKSQSVKRKAKVTASVLNASRHHRKNRCGHAAHTLLLLRVLNASRHHRKNRRPLLSTKRSVQACSTPRGSTGKIAGRCGATYYQRKACSTPRGITGKIAL